MSTTITGTAGNDSLVGIASADADEEIFIGTTGNDTLDGGVGDDYMYFNGVTGPLNISFVTGTVTGTGVNTTFSNMEAARGSEQNDTITGSGADEGIAGGGGNDSLVGGGGFDYLDYIFATGSVNVNLAAGTATGEGTDTISGFEAIIGSGFNDTLTGDGANNWIEGGLGNDSLVGGLGFDTVGFSDGDFDAGVEVDLSTGLVIGDAGNDTISGFEAVVGSSGDDTLIGDGNANRLDGGLGGDEFHISLGNDTLVGGGLGGDADFDILFFDAIAGPVTVNFSSGTATGSGVNTTFSDIRAAVGTTSNDTILGSSEDEAMAGRDGIDSLVGGAGRDLLYYGFASGAVGVNIATNVVSGADGADIISGFENVAGSNFNDTLIGSDGDNWIEGGLGNDSLVGGLGFDTLSLSADEDPLSGVSANLATGVVTGGVGNDTISGFEAIEATEFNDTLIGDGFDNIFTPAWGDDSVVGGGGFDTVDYSERHGGGPSGVNVNLTAGTASGTSGNDTLSGIRGVIGSDDNDTITGAGAASRLDGGAGNDSLFGQGSNDTLLGGDGVDSLNGGGGNDSLVGGFGHDGLFDGSGGFDTLAYADYLSTSNGYVFNYSLQGFNGFSTMQVSGIGNAYFEQDNGIINIEQIAGTSQDDVMRDLGNDREIEFNPGRGNDMIVGSPYDGSLDYVHYDDITDPDWHLHIDLDPAAQSLYTDGDFTGNAALFDGATQIEVDHVQSIGGIYGTAGGDEILGSPYTPIEFFQSGAGADTVDGRGGFDIADYGNAERAVNITLAAVGSPTMVADDGYGAGSIDTLLNIEALHGSAYADVLTGNAADNRLRGRAGNDTLDGGAGLDIADYRNASSALNITLAESGDTIVTDGQGGTDLIRNFEGLRGGNGTNDLLSGNSAANALFGLGGDDTLSGGGGNDTLDGQAGFDTLSYNYLTDAAGYSIGFSNGAGTVTVAGQGGNATYLEIDKVTSVDAIRGSGLADAITDVVAGRFMYLGGGTGNDSLAGNAADYDFAIYNERDNTHVVTANLGTGVVTVTKTTDGGYLETDTLTNIRGIWGGQGGDSMLGGSADEYFRGFAGNDTIDGGSGMDIADFRSGTVVTIALVESGDTVVSDGQSGTDTLRNVEGISATLGNDSLTGNSLDNYFRGRAGNDTINGGAGNDTLSHTTAGSAVDANLNTGVVKDGEGGTDAVSNIEHLLGGDYNDSLSGNSAGNKLEGLSGDDTLTGSGGSDTLDGGSGFDSASYTYLSDFNGYNFVLSSGSMVVTGKGGNSGYTETDQIANIDAWFASSGADGMTDQVAGRQSYFQGRGGNDTLTGNVQDTDFTVYWERGSTVAVNANLATGIVSVTDSANLSYSETDNLVGINGAFGGSGNDSLTGNNYNNYFRGGAGADSIDGGDGFDTVGFSNALQGVYVQMGATGVSFNAWDGVDSLDTINNVEGIDGSNYDDHLVGNGADNSLRGRKGFDKLDGGAGLDWADYASGEYAVNITLAETGNTLVNDDGFGSGDVLVSIEGLYGTGHSDRLTGNSQDNAFSGREGNDTIDGLGGSDSVSFTFSSAALDIDMAESGTDTVVNDGTGGIDILRNIESIRASNFDDSVTGNSQDNVLWGNQGDDHLAAGFGNDTLVGDDGNDDMDGGDGIDIVSFSSASGAVTASLVTGLATGAGNDGFDNVEGLAGTRFNDSLVGGNAANGTDVLDGLLLEIFRGDGGNDTIDGGQGYDRADYSNSTAGVSVVLNDALDGTAQDGLGGTDTLRGIEGVRGSAHNDTLTGSATAVFESFEGGAGNDIINGNGGTDRADYRRATSGVVASLASGTASDGEGGTDSLSGIENLRGSLSFNDSLTGDGGNNRLEGLGGNDTLLGGGGDDSYGYFLGTDGADAIEDSAGAADVLTVQEVEGTPDHFPEFERVANDLLLRLYDNETGQPSGSLTLKNHFTSGTIETLESYNKNGTLEASWLLATGLTGTVDNEIIAGGSSGDSIVGGAGDDWLFGAGGNDTIDAGAGNDTLSGGPGNDSLLGGDDDDTYAWLPGDLGNDIIVDSAGNADQLKVEVEGFAYTAERVGGTLEDLLFTASANGIVTSSVTIVGHYADGRVENLVLGPPGAETEYQFVSGLFGTESADWVVGTNVADTCVGGGGGDQMFGGLGDDSLEGNAGDDVLSGGAGDDTLAGGDGSDTYVVESAGDLVVDDGVDGGAVDTVNALISYTLTANIENLVLFGDADLAGTGNGLANALQGNTGDNSLDGAAGSDNLAGGTGNDTYFVDDLGDVVVELDNEPEQGQGVPLDIYAGVLDTVNATVDFTLSAFIENLVLAGITDLSGGGNELRNELTGNDGDNLLQGFGDGDTLSGGLGNDTLEGGTGNDSIVGGGDNDVARFVGNRSDYSLSFNAGGGFYTVVSALEGVDTVSGVESFEFADVTVDAGIIVAGGTFNGTSAAENFTGGVGADTLLGNGGNDTLEGGPGDDSLNGGTGAIDTVSYAGAGVGVIVSLTTKSASGGAGNDIVDNFENILGSAFDDSLTGNTAANTIEGGAGNDTINGGAGDDFMVGGDGSDQYTVDSLTEQVVETNADSVTGGSDTVFTGLASYTLGVNVENLRLTSAGVASGTGNGLNNMIWAGSGNNTLDGAAGNDTVSYTFASAAVFGSLTSNPRLVTGGSGTDTLLNIENLIGSNYSDSLVGNTLANRLEGAGGGDTLNGGANADTMIGGSGTDLFYVDNAGDQVIETGSDPLSGNDNVWSTISYLLPQNVENLRLIGAGAINASGNELNNTLYSGDGNNVLDGGDGIDTVSYAFIAGAVTVSLALTGVAQATVAAGSDTLIGIENLTGSNYDDMLMGNAGDNLIEGGVGTDTMSYANSAAAVFASLTSRTASGGEGNDILRRIENLIGSAHNDTLIGSIATNQLTGGDGADSLNGGKGNDTLLGGNANDTLVGGDGQDQMTGGAGADVFDLNASRQSGITNLLWDSITDFSTAQGDKIDLASIDARIGVTGDQAFTSLTNGAAYSATTTFTASGQLFFDQTADVLYGNTDADAEAEFAIELIGVASMSLTDLLA